jgi:hypothetical protein
MVTQRGRKDAAGRINLVEVQLAFPRQDITDLPPVHQIPAVKNRDAGEVFKRTVDQVIILAHAANARVGMEPRDDGIGKRVRGTKAGQRSEAQQQKQNEAILDRHWVTFVATAFRTLNRICRRQGMEIFPNSMENSLMVTSRGVGRGKGGLALRE